MTARHPMLGDNWRLVDMREVVEAMAKLLFSWESTGLLWEETLEDDRDVYRDSVIKELLPVSAGWSGL